MKKLTILFIFVFLYSISFSQEFTVNGMVKDQKTDNPIIGAAVFELGDATIGTATDTEGFFSLRFSKKHILLKVAYIGYRDTVFDMYLKNDTALIINLISKTDISEVEIEDDSINWKPDENDLSVENKIIIAEGADKKNVFKPKPVIIKKNTAEKPKIDELFLSDNNSVFGKLIFIDGARIYFPEQRLKLIPFFDKNSVSDYIFYPANFPAEYGGHTAPVLDIKMKEGDMQRYRGQIDFNLFASGISASGPVIKDQSSFFISFRKAYINNPYTELFRKDKSADEEYWSEPAFWDLNLKYAHKINENNRFFVSFFHNSNRLKTNILDFGTFIGDTPDYSDKNINSDYGNTATVLHFKHTFTKDFNFNAAFIFSRYNLKQSFTGDSVFGSYINRYDAIYTSGNEDITLKLNSKYTINNEHFLRFGANAVNHHFRPVKASLILNDFEHPNNIDTTWEANTVNAQEYSVFARDKFIINDDFTVNGGLRFSAFVNSGKTYFSVEPRIFADYKLFKFLSLNIAYAYHKEYVHLLSGNSAGLTSDIFIPSSENILPQITNHFAAGAELNLPSDIKLNGTVFYDNIVNLYDYNENFNYFDYPGKLVLTGMNIEERIIPAKGNYTGIRTTLSKKYKGLSVNIGHTISDFSVKTDSINFGQSYQYRNNHRHDFNIKLSYAINENIKVFANWIYQAGNYVSLQKQHYIPYDYNDGELGTKFVLNPTMYLTDYTESSLLNRNDFQLPAYHRLDIGANYVLDNHTFGIRIYNVYNRKNADIIDYKRSVLTNNAANQLVKFTNLPFFPTISYSFRFEN